jgi:hypothetical protein
MGVRSHPVGYKEEYLKMLDEGYVGVIFTHIKDPEYALDAEFYNSSRYNVTKTNDLIIISNKECNTSDEKIILKYLDEYNIRTRNNQTYNEVMKSVVGW